MMGTGNGVVGVGGQIDKRIWSISCLYKCLNFKGATADVVNTTPPPLLLLLANHRTILLYLGHGNVLLLSPLADTMCCNLQKIGWEKSEETGRREEPS